MLLLNWLVRVPVESILLFFVQKFPDCKSTAVHPQKRIWFIPQSSEGWLFRVSNVAACSLQCTLLTNKQTKKHCWSSSAQCSPEECIALVWLVGCSRPINQSWNRETAIQIVFCEIFFFFLAFAIILRYFDYKRITGRYLYEHELIKQSPTKFILF